LNELAIVKDYNKLILHLLTPQKLCSPFALIIPNSIPSSTQDTSYATTPRPHGFPNRLRQFQHFGYVKEFLDHVLTVFDRRGCDFLYRDAAFRNVIVSDDGSVAFLECYLRWTLNFVVPPTRHIALMCNPIAQLPLDFVGRHSNMSLESGIGKHDSVITV
jgi:hypothetical protein